MGGRGALTVLWLGGRAVMDGRITLGAFVASRTVHTRDTLGPDDRTYVVELRPGPEIQPTRIKGEVTLTGVFEAQSERVKIIFGFKVALNRYRVSDRSLRSCGARITRKSPLSASTVCPRRACGSRRTLNTL